jgi:hypothetical protein
MMKRFVTYGELCEESGVGMETVARRWRTRGAASVPNLEAVLNTLGYKLAAVPMKEPLDELGRVKRICHEPLPLKGKGRGNWRSSKKYQQLQETTNG